MRTALILFIILWPALAAGLPDNAPDEHAVVLLDASASMAGFFAKGSICPMVEEVERSLQQTQFTVQDKAFKFESGGQDVSDTFSNCKTIVANGQITLIDRAYSAAIQSTGSAGRPSTVWVITDNVQDPQSQSQENDDIRQFYSVLEQSAEEVHLFIRTPDFSGPIYGKDGRSILNPQYSGRRGLLVYAILLNRSAKEQFENAIGRFERHKFPNDPSGIRIKGFSPLPVATELGKAGDAEHVRMSPVDATIIFDKVFSEHERIKCSFQMNFRNGPENLIIDQATVTPRVLEPFQLFVGETKFDVKDPQLRATPPHLSSRIVPPGAQGASNQAVQLTIDFPEGVEFPHSPKYLWSYIWQPRADRYEGKISVALRAQKANMNLAPDLIERYNAGEEYFRLGNPDQSKIYGLQSLFQQLNAHADQYVDIPAKTIPVEFSVSPPQWPLAALIVIAIALVLAFLLLSRALIGPEFQLETLGAGSYRLSLRRNRATQRPSRNDDFWGGATSSGSLQEGLKRIRLPIFAKHPVKENGSLMGELCRSPWEIRVRAAAGYSVNGGQNGRLSSQGGAFNFVQGQGESSGLQQTAEQQPRQARQRRANGSDSFFDS